MKCPECGFEHVRRTGSVDVDVNVKYGEVKRSYFNRGYFCKKCGWSCKGKFKG